MNRAVVLAFILSGCATVPPPEVVKEAAPSTEVRVVVPVSCVSEVPPIPAPTKVDPKASTVQLAAAAAADVYALQAYAEKTHALLLACRDVKEQP